MTIGSGLRRKQKKKRGLTVVLVILVLMGIAAGWRLFGLHTVAEKFTAYFTTAANRPVSADGVRGTIYDRNYKELAVSLPRVSVFARSREMQSIEEAAKALAPLLGQPAAELLEKLRGDELRIWLAKDISEQQEDAVRKANISGVYLHKEYSRYYPQKTVAAHLVGFVQDDIGLAGLEYYYDRLVQKMLRQDSSTEFRGGAGQHLLLSIDLKVQLILEKLVEDLSVGRPNVRIGAYAMDAGSGAMVASVQYPSFDPNRYRIYSQSLLDSLLVKPMLLPAAFRIILRDSAAMESQYEARGQVHPWSISERQQSLGGELRLWEKLGLDAGAPQEFGNNESQLSRSAETFVVKRQESRDFGTVPESLSPLNLLVALSTLTNGGRKIEPHVVQAVVDPESDAEYQLRPEAGETPLSEVINDKASREISKMMTVLGEPNELGGVIIRGEIHADVGSADGFGHVGNELYVAAVPIEHAEVILLLTIQGGDRQVPDKSGPKLVDPGKGLADVLPRIAVLQEVGKSIAGVAEPSEGNGNYPVHLDKVREAVRSSLEESSADETDPGRMPQLIGLSLRKSLRLLQRGNCRIRVYGSGRVVSQQPEAGEPLAGVKECVIRMQKEEVTPEALEEKSSKKK